MSMKKIFVKQIKIKITINLLFIVKKLNIEIY